MAAAAPTTARRPAGQDGAAPASLARLFAVLLIEALSLMGNYY